MKGSRRRSRLRDFQAQLVERLRSARSGVVTHVNELGIQIGAARYLLRLDQVGEITSIGQLVPVPLTRDWYLGLTSIRGELVSVIDLAHFLGGPVSRIDKDSRILALAPSLALNAGLLVSKVIGLRNTSEIRSEITSGVDAGLLPDWASESCIDRDRQVWSRLDLSLAIKDPRFMQVGI